MKIKSSYFTSSKPTYVSVLLFLLTCLYFCSLALYFSRPFYPVDDFWWHLSTGRWIWQNAELPLQDPFSYTTLPTSDIRQSLILKGYWLSQVIYYLIYITFGWSGLIVCKTLLFTSILFSLWRLLMFKAVDPFAALVAISPIPFILSYFISLRPHTLSFLFTIILFYCIEKGIKSLREKELPSPLSLKILPIIMLVWGNVHLGFFIGTGMAGIYLFTETTKYIFKKNALNPEAYKNLAFWLIASILTSFINPNHVLAILSFFDKSLVGSFINTVEEFKTMINFYLFVRDLPLLYLHLALGIATFLIMLISWRRLKLSHVVLYIGFTVAGLSTYRFSIFYAIMAVAISGEYFADLIKKRIKIIKPISIIFILCLSLFTISRSYSQSAFARGPISHMAPSKVANFISTNKLPAPIFNPYEWGGYFIWSLYPQYKVYVDSRALQYEPYNDYLKAQKNKDIVFNKYGIKTVVYYYVNKKGPLSGLIFQMLLDSKWKVVYFDSFSVVFVLSKDMLSLQSKNQEFISHLLKSANAIAFKDPNNANNYLMLGQLHYLSGKTERSIENFQKALSIDPVNNFAMNWLRFLTKKQ